MDRVSLDSGARRLFRTSGEGALIELEGETRLEWVG